MPLPRKKRPEEVKQEAAGNAFIQQREQRAAQLQPEGGNVRAAQQQAAQEIGRQEEARQAASPEGQIMEARLRKEAIDKAIGEVKPKESPQPLQPSKTPQVIGQVGEQTAQQQFINQAPNKTGLVNQINLFGAKLGAGSLVEKRKEITQKAGESAAQVIDAVTSVFSARKSADIITAEASFNDAMNILNKDVDLVRKGLKSPIEARANMVLAKNAVQRLEGSQKALGKLNLRYWLGGGKEIEGEIIVYKGLIDNLDLELQQAEIEAQQVGLQNRRAEAMAQLGL